jgi:hypothetical protein
MLEPAFTNRSSVFPFPPTPRFTNLTEVCNYLNVCGFDITWQSFHRTYSSYIANMRSIIHQKMRAHGIETKLGDPSMHDKISMLIVRDMIDDHLRHDLVQAVQQRAYANKAHVAHRLIRYSQKIVPPKGTTRQQMMLAHLDAVLEAVLESLDAYNGGQSNQGYLTRLYHSSMQSTMASVQIIRRPEQWFVVLENQQDLTVDVIVPRFAKSYAALFHILGSLIREEKSDLNQLFDEIGSMKAMEYDISRASIRPGACIIEARSIVDLKKRQEAIKHMPLTKERLELVRTLKKEATEKRAKASRKTMVLARLLWNQEKHKENIANIVREGKTIQIARQIREEMKKTLKSFGCSAMTEKKIYRGCAILIENYDAGHMTSEEFEEGIYNLVLGELKQIAKRSVVDSMAHAAVIDYRVADFISELFNVDRNFFERRRFDFAQHIAKHLNRDSQDYSSGSHSSSSENDEIILGSRG